MLWKLPPRIKVYEALGAIADERIKLMSQVEAIVTSSSGNKHYQVLFNPSEHELSVNDNGSYWQGYLGYPGIAFLMVIDLLPLNDPLAQLLKNIEWKKLNQKYGNDFKQTEAYLNKMILNPSASQSADSVLLAIKKLKLARPAHIPHPPASW